MPSSDDGFFVFDIESDETDDYSDEYHDYGNKKYYGQLKLAKLKSLPQTLNWEMEKERREFLKQLYPLIRDWRRHLPDLRGIFGRVKMDLLLTEDLRNYQNTRGNLVEFAIKTGYRDEPVILNDNKPSSHRTTPVHRLAKTWVASEDRIKPGQWAHYLFQIYNRFDVNYTDESGLTHFHIACKYDCYRVVRKFLEFGQDPNCFWSETGDSPLHLTSSSKVAELLLRSGINPNSTNAKGMTPLHSICSRYKDNDLVKIFFKIIDKTQQTVQVDARDNLGNTPLLLALAHGNKTAAKFLLNRGADPKLSNAKGWTSLHFIYKRSSYDCGLAELFFKTIEDIQLTVQIDALDEAGNTPLHLAFENCYNNKNSGEGLLRRGANPNLVDKDGLTPLHIISKNCYNDDLIKMLFKISDEKHQSVQIEARDNEGNTPLHLALFHQHTSVSTFLLRRGADPTVTNLQGLTPLHVICKTDDDDGSANEFLEICDEVQKTVRIDALDNLGRTPLQWAVVTFLPDAVKALLHHGADLSSFVFPTASFFDEGLELQRDQCEIRLSSGLLAIVENLEEAGYELNRSDALTIMTFFASNRYFHTCVGDEEHYNGEDFKDEVKEIYDKRGKSEAVAPRPDGATTRRGGRASHVYGLLLAHQHG
ncbi:unnamed protein product [Trichogramma brassicae]|uniref:Uncharacterized protein n=1 Tax=Trichogramma brassicae TaxID=86971 RepID=A0A6H5IIW4_9HYME|nr:unnamed protein product [Trichogramma brassicae]